LCKAASAGTFAVQAHNPDQPIEQTRKNIQVLKGLPESQLFLLMNFMAASIDFDDYRDVDGIKLPFMIRSSNTATYDTATRRFTEIKHNLTVDDNAFNLTTSLPP
jgi:hypothetical protein